MANGLTIFLKKFHSIRVEDDEMIEAATELRIYKQNEYLFAGGKVCREIFFVCRGVLRTFSLNENGNEVTHFFIPENRFCSILNSFMNQVATDERIVAACDTEVLAITYSKLRLLYAQLPYLEPLITKIIQQALLDKIAVKNAYLGRDSSSQYQKFLDEQPDIAARVSLTDVASYLGITPQSLSRIRKNNR